jgi:hypothetical protein
MRRTFVRICLETKALNVQKHCALAIQKQSLDEEDAFMSEVSFDIVGAVAAITKSEPGVLR